MKRLNILIVDRNRARARMLCKALAEDGHDPVHTVEEGGALLQSLGQIQPDVVIMDIESPDRDTLEQVSVINEHHACPVVMFSHDGRAEQIEAAVEAGVAAYVVDALSAERVRPVVDVAVARYRKYRALQQKLDNAHKALDDRKSIDRAKGILMKQQGLDEDSAYQKIRKLAMDQHVSMGDLSRKVIAAAALLG